MIFLIKKVLIFSNPEVDWGSYLECVVLLKEKKSVC